VIGCEDCLRKDLNFFWWGIVKTLVTHSPPPPTNERESEIQCWREIPYFEYHPVYTVSIDGATKLV